MFIYIHLPFCRSKCIYCDFVVDIGASQDKRTAYLAALKSEMTHFLGQAKDLRPIETIYFGGGTPSLFSAKEIKSILDTLTSYAELSVSPEITLEMNPDGIESPLKAYRQVGINRLSIGIQSLQANELKRLSRIHSRDRAITMIHEAKVAGFENISIDLMYGTPEQSLESWQRTLEEVVTLPVQHISAYGLQVEDGTKLEKLIRQGKMTIANDDTNADEYEQAVTFLAKHGFERYEISNFAQAGYTSRHNMNYWQQGEAWAFGVGAHGFLTSAKIASLSTAEGKCDLKNSGYALGSGVSTPSRIRYENTDSLTHYLENPTQRAKEHHVDDAEHLENTLIFGLRTRDGVDLSQLNPKETALFEHAIRPRLEKYIHDGWITLEDHRLQLAPQAFVVSNSILSEITT